MKWILVLSMACVAFVSAHSQAIVTSAYTPTVMKLVDGSTVSVQGRKSYGLTFEGLSKNADKSIVLVATTKSKQTGRLTVNADDADLLAAVLDLVLTVKKTNAPETEVDYSMGTDMHVLVKVGADGQSISAVKIGESVCVFTADELRTLAKTLRTTITQLDAL